MSIKQNGLVIKLSNKEFDLQSDFLGTIMPQLLFATFCDWSSTSQFQWCPKSTLIQDRSPAGARRTYSSSIAGSVVIMVLSITWIIAYLAIITFLPICPWQLKESDFMVVDNCKHKQNSKCSPLWLSSSKSDGLAGNISESLLQSSLK